MDIIIINNSKHHWQPLPAAAAKSFIPIYQSWCLTQKVDETKSKPLEKCFSVKDKDLYSAKIIYLIRKAGNKQIASIVAVVI